MAEKKFSERVIEIALAVAKGQAEAIFPLLSISIASAVAVLAILESKAGASVPRISNPASWQSVVAFGIGFVLVTTTWLLGSYVRGRAQRAFETQYEEVTKRASAHPERPELAWEVGRAKLEKYLDRNISQVRTIAVLTYTVMFVGFGFILFGLAQSFNNPANLPVSIVSAGSGVLVSFIGGSFLLVYRSLLRQSREYVTVLERINGVGMAVAIIAGIPDESAELKNATTADLAKTLLTLYAPK